MLAQQKDVPADASVLVIAGPKTDFFAPEARDAASAIWRRAASSSSCSIRRDKAGRRQITNVIALLKEWAIEVGNNVVVDVSGMGQLLGTGPECRSRAELSSRTRSPIASAC